MRILLIHNPKAGDGKHSKKQLMTSLTRCGHQAFYQLGRLCALLSARFCLGRR